MATAQNVSRVAWALEVIGPATIRWATTDLPEDAAVATLGAFYTKGILSADSRIVDGLPNLFWGIRRRNAMDVILDNSSGDMDTTADWRGAPFTLYHYDRELDVKRTDLVGLVLNAQFANGRCTMTLGTADDALMQEQLPAATVDPQVGSPFETSGSPGAPLPVVFGNDVLLRPVHINRDPGSTQVSAFDYAVGFGANLQVTAAYGEYDSGRTGLEAYGSWEGAPGAPAYFPDLDPIYAATRFAVTGDQSARYGPDSGTGMPIRFKTAASGANYVYSAVKQYISTTTPHLVEIYDQSLGTGLSHVEIVGDYQIIRDAYAAVTTGLLPEPATAQAITALRLFGQEDTALLASVSNPSFPSGSGGTNPATIIGDILTNSAWGLSTRVQQLTDPTTFASAGVIMAIAGLNGAIQGALGYDGKQVAAGDALDWLLMIARGGRLNKNAARQWTLSVDTLASIAATFSFGPGEESGPRIKRVVSYGRAPLDRAVRNVVLHWKPLGRANVRNILVSSSGYARSSTKAASGVGQDRQFFNPFIRTDTVAEIVVQYLAEMLKGADEQLVFIAGQEARDRIVGEVVTVVSTVDGISGDWKIIEISRSLMDVQITAIRHRTQAYDAPSGIVHSAEPSDTVNSRTPPGPGPNLLPNPDPSPPMRISDGFTHFGYEIPGQQLPYGWRIGKVDGVLTELSFDKSEATRLKTVSGHYGRMVWASVTSGPPLADGGDGLFTEPGGFFVRKGSDHIISFYGDAADGWFINILENDLVTSTVLSLIRDSTDTDQNGWTRFYARWRPQTATTGIILGLCVSKAGTYQFAGLAVVPVSGSIRRPPDWRRHMVAPLTLTRSQEVTFDGSSSYSVPLIKAGDYAVGATARITSAPISGTATLWSLGTANDPEIWARNQHGFALNDRTTSSDYKPGSVKSFFAADSNVILTFNGTATTGKAMVVYEYTRSAPTPGT